MRQPWPGDHPVYGDGGLNRPWLTNLVIHELGHLQGLYHALVFTNIPVVVETKAAAVPNFMSHDTAFKTSLEFADFQKRMIHSYLELAKGYNGYQEPPPVKATKMAQG